MRSLPLPPDEGNRLDALRVYGLCSVGREEEFDLISRVAADLLNTPIALVTIVGEHEQSCAGAAGTALSRTPRDHAFCAYTILDDTLMVVEDAERDPRFRDNPMVKGPPFIRFYAGMPLLVGGARVGSLCAIDSRPRSLSDEEARQLRDLSRLAERHMESRLAAMRNAENERRLENLIAAMPVALAVYDADDRLQRSNTRYREAFFGRADLVPPPGISFRDLLALMEAEGPGIRIGDSADWKAERVRRRRNTGVPYEMKVGSAWLVCHEVVQPDGGLVAIFSDVTELKAREAALEAQSDLMRSTLESLEEGIAVFDEAGTLITANDAYARLLDLPETLRRNGSPLGAHAENISAKNSGPEGSRLLRALSGADGDTIELQSRQGRTLSLSSRLSAQRRRIIVTCADVTDRREVERLKDEFVSTVSHELRTPLTSITGSLGLLAGGAAGELPPRAARLVEIAHKNVDRLSRLVNDLLDIDRIESGQLEFRRERIDLRTVAAHAVEQNRPYAERYEVMLDCQVLSTPAPVIGDSDRLLQAATNLISNAVKYSPAGGWVTVAVTNREGRARLSVTDRGPGIPESFRKALFQRFAQADASDRRARQGTGLGLSIALAIVGRHGGSIEVETESGKGTTMHIDLPVAAGRESLSPQAGEGPAILICEDDGFAGSVMRRYLERTGARVDLTASISEARERLQTRRYDALVLDLLLPDGNSLELIRDCRTGRVAKDLPIVVVSAVADATRRSDEAAELDVSDWMEKPVDLARLAAAVAGRGAGGSARPLVLHIEDDPDTFRLVELALSEVADLEWAKSVADARARVQASRYDAAILDLAHPDGSGVDLLPDLVGAPFGPVPTIIFSVRDPPSEIAGAVSGALTKSRSSLRHLAETVRQLAALREADNG
jgi:signal transduction histidine kinase/DNA-binding response OmpR family regulator